MNEQAEDRTDFALPRVVLVTQVCILRESLQRAIDTSHRCIVLGTAKSAAEAMIEIASRLPDIVLADASLASRREFTQNALLAAPAVKVIAFAVSDDEEQIMACAEAGVNGYVVQQASLAELIDTLYAVMRGELICPPRVAAQAFHHIFRLASHSHQLPAARADLPRRQQQILSLIEQGLSNKEIARTLNLAPSTVKNHVHSLLVRMGVARRTQAAAWRRLKAGPFDLDRQV